MDLRLGFHQVSRRAPEKCIKRDEEIGAGNYYNELEIMEMN